MCSRSRPFVLGLSLSETLFEKLKFIIFPNFFLNDMHLLFRVSRFVNKLSFKKRQIVCLNFRLLQLAIRASNFEVCGEGAWQVAQMVTTCGFSRDLLSAVARHWCTVYTVQHTMPECKIIRADSQIASWNNHRPTVDYCPIRTYNQLSDCRFLERR